MIDFDVVLNQIGGFGIIQKLLGFIIGYTAILSGFNTMSVVFINYTPDHRCWFPPIDNDNSSTLTQSEILELITPKNDDGSYNYCKMYQFNASLCDEVDDLSNCINQSDTTLCNYGHYYDRSIFSETVITEFDLVCDNVTLDSLATALYMVGILIGSVFFGIFSDKLGRKPVLIGSCVLAFGALFGSGFTHDYTWFVVTRVILAAFGYGIFLSSFVYLVEICANTKRSLLGIGYQASFAAGYMILSGLAYEWRDWHELVIVSGLFGLPFACVMFFIPESPRWLFSVKKDEQAKIVSSKGNWINLKVFLN